MHWSRLLFLLLVSVVLLSACQPQVVTVEVTRLVTADGETAAVATTPTPIAPQITAVVEEVVEEIEVTRIVPVEVTVEVTKAPLGTAARPVQLLFPPTVDTAVISARGETLAAALQEATDRSFAVGVLDNEQAVIDLLCAAPMDVVAFLSPAGYVVANAQCGAQVATVAQESDGLTWEAGMIVTRRDSGVAGVEDLNGRRWAVPDMDSLAAHTYFQALFAEAGIEPGEIIEVPGESAAMLAVYNGEADFATAAYVPPILPYEERPWQYGEDDPEIWRRTGIAPSRSPIGYVLVNGEPENGGYRLRDARSRVFDVEPGIYDETQVVALSAQIPNDTVAFGRDFPLELARDVMATLTAVASTEACENSLCAADFYGWTGVTPAEDSAYEPIRFVRDTLNLTAEEILQVAQ